MEDNQIIQLYFDRSEEAISQTAVKHGKYCHTIAYISAFILTMMVLPK